MTDPTPSPLPAFRTPDERFDALADFLFEPRYLEWEGLRVHHVDVPAAGGDPDAPVMLLVHGEPTWSYLYRGFVGPLTAAGFRVIAPDHVGFGRSDKPVDDEWYVIERHVERLRHLIDTLDLRRVTIVVQDWGGPIGLRQVVDQPARFERVVILNTWLHHEGLEYSDGVRWWREMATDPEKLGGDMPVGSIVAGSLGRPGHDTAALTAAYDAPFDGHDSKAGARRFPFCIPFAEPTAGNAADQQRCWDALRAPGGPGGLGLPVHIAFGDSDPIFTWDWAQQWHAELTGSTLDRIEGATHFVQEDATEDVAAAILRHAVG